MNKLYDEKGLQEWADTSGIDEETLDGLKDLLDSRALWIQVNKQIKVWKDKRPNFTFQFQGEIAWESLGDSMHAFAKEYLK